MNPLPFLVEPEQLQAQLGKPELLIIDMRPLERYSEGHIATAVQLDYANIISAVPPAGGLLPSEDQLSTVLSAIGLTPRHQVVAYDDEGGGRAGRLLWTLDAVGHQYLSLLNGGIIAWNLENRSLSRDSISPQPGHYRANYTNPAVVATKEHILSRLGQPDFISLDTRTPNEYLGTDVRATRGGHIPGAVNLNWIDCIDRDRGLRFRQDKELRSMLEGLGVTPEKEVIAYCQTHHRSSHTCMVLKYLGYERARGYPGAWSDWGNDPEMPVET